MNAKNLLNLAIGVLVVMSIISFARLIFFDGRDEPRKVTVDGVECIKYEGSIDCNWDR